MSNEVGVEALENDARGITHHVCRRRAAKTDRNIKSDMHLSVRLAEQRTKRGSERRGTANTKMLRGDKRNATRAGRRDMRKKSDEESTIRRERLRVRRETSVK